MNILAASQHSSIQNLFGQSTSSLNTDQQELLLANYNLPGLRIDGRMSAVRRFFCLFVTFDLLFTALFWIICVLINGQSLKDGLSKEILHYSFVTSMFDMVVCSGLRFLFLLLFYAVIYIQHYWVVAVTTFLSTSLVAAKSVLFQWNSSDSSSSNNNYPFQVLLLLIAFIITWSEAWFIDYSVMPQEARAKNLLRALSSSNSVMEAGRGGGRLRDYLSQCAAESVANFYSPLQSPYESEDEDCEPRIPKLTQQESVWQCLGIDAVLRSHDLLRSSADWKLHSQPNSTDTISTRQTLQGKKIYKITGPIPAPAELLFRDTVDNIEQMHTWNSAVTAVRKVQVLSSSTDIVHQITSDVPGGVIKSRDFVMVRHWRCIQGCPLDEWSACWITGGMSVTHPEVPVTKQHIRGENGPGCWAFCEPRSAPGEATECTFHWLLETDLKGWIPRSIVDSALAKVMAEQLVALRKRAEMLLHESKTQTAIAGDTSLAESSISDATSSAAAGDSVPSSTQSRQDRTGIYPQNYADDNNLIDVQDHHQSSYQPIPAAGDSLNTVTGTVAKSLPPVNYPIDDNVFRDCEEQDNSPIV
uniref:StAR-related lipid transfer protein 3-like n=1 Tax=Hirondellea gigas TaxID=1518452 RepID=A0A2P2I6W5_9CRUS